MIYLLFGPDKYRLEKRLSEIKKAANAESEGVNCREMSSNFNCSEIISEASSMPFLSEKRVLILKGLLGSKDKGLLEKIGSWVADCPPETELIFVEDDAPDQRLSISKFLNKNVRVENFAPLSQGEMIKAIQQMVHDKGGETDQSAAAALYLYVGGDRLRINNEIDKLVSYNRKVTKESVDLLVDAGYFNTIFDLTDAISAKNQPKALGLLMKALESGENESYVLSMVGMQIRNLLLVADLASHRLTESEIVAKAKLHPYVVKKTLSMAKNFEISRLISLHREILSIDESIKTTSYDPVTLLTAFVIKATSK